MISQEYLELLQQLDACDSRMRRCGLDADARGELIEEIAGVKAKLPTALIGYHERMLRAGRKTVVQLSGSASCGGCHMKLPSGIVSDLKRPGYVAVCPHCGSFVFKEHATALAGAH